jgi:hypothetical protein
VKARSAAGRFAANFGRKISRRAVNRHIGC